MAGTKIAKCFCVSEFQDKEYGKQNRVWNLPGPKGNTRTCTVCGKTEAHAKPKEDKKDVKQ
jgi:hypothetical protein